MFDILSIFEFGQKFTVDGVDWIRIQGLGDGQFMLAVRGDDTFPAPTYVIRNPNYKKAE